MALRLEDHTGAGPLDLDAFYAEFAPRVRALIRRKVRNDDRVDDLLQETFLRAHRNAASFDSTKPAWPWLATIATRLVIDASRRGSSRNESPAELHVLDRATATIGPEEQYARVERRRHIAAALGALPSRQRRVLLLREVDDYRYDAVAAEEDISVDTVKALLRRARVGFRHAYEQATAERGLLGALPFFGRRLWARLQEATSRYSPSVSRLIESVGAPIAAIVVAAGLAAVPFLGHQSHASTPIERADAVVAGSGASGALDRLAGAETSVRSNPAPSSNTPPSPHGGLLPGKAGATNRLDASGDNLESGTQFTMYLFGSPLTIWTTGVTQCHTNQVHDAVCAAAQQLPNNLNVGDPQDPPTPDDPPPPPSL